MLWQKKRNIFAVSLQLLKSAIEFFFPHPKLECCSNERSKDEKLNSMLVSFGLPSPFQLIGISAAGCLCPFPSFERRRHMLSVLDAQQSTDARN